MDKTIETTENEGQPERRVIKHIGRPDLVLIFMPMVVTGILFIAVPLVWSIAERLGGHPSEVGGFNFDGLVVAAGFVLCLIFCVAYGLLALLLALLTFRNRTFRLLLASISIVTAVVGGIWLFR